MSEPVVELVAIGTELLGPTRTDTNALTLARALAGVGLAITRKTTLPDYPEPLFDALQGAIGRADLLITTGGLGPTVDDVTRQTLSEVTGIDLVHEPEVEAAIRRRFGDRRIEMPDNNLTQAWVPGRGTWFPNPNGTAPGLVFEPEGKLVVALPGPPRELAPMLENPLVPLLEKRFARDTRVLTRALHTANVSESWVDATLVAPMRRFPGVEVSMLARPGYVDITLARRVGKGMSEDEELDGAHRAAGQALAPHVYSDSDATLAEVVGALLFERKATLAVAESCTGGLIGAELTEVAGSSAYFLAGLCTYANAAKEAVLGVPHELIEAHGAVSREVARAMAAGACERGGADYGLSTTGIAGPGGGTVEKPVGLVYVGLSHAGKHHEVEFHFGGSRAAVRERAVAAALDLLRRFIP